MKKRPPDFRQRKRTVVLAMLGAGMAVALAWCLWAGVGQGKGYPESYLLGAPNGRFSDFNNETLAASLPNPYADPISFYPPGAFVLFRALDFSNSIGLVIVSFASAAALALLLTRLLQPTMAGAWSRVAISYVFVVISYPLLFCIDRGNIEIVMAPLIGWALYFYSRRQDGAGTACLFPAICLKLYPAILLVFLLRRRKVGLAVLCGVGAVLATIICLFLFPAPAMDLWSAYRKDLDFYRDFYLLGNGPIEGSASFWNTYKIALMALQKMHWIPTINFGFDGPLIGASYHIYSAALALAALACAFYAWLYERLLARGMLMILLLLSIAAPNGADYRLMYASMALALLMILPRRRRGDWTALVVVALAVIPKKEVLLTFVGTSETGFADVPIQAVLNPLLILLAMGILLYYARRPFEWSGIVSRLRGLFFTRWRWV